MSQPPRQEQVPAIGKAWAVLALLLLVMGGTIAFYNPWPAVLFTLMALIATWRAWCNRTPDAPQLNFYLRPDPDPGAVGGDIGGWLVAADDNGSAFAAPMITLRCMRLCERRRSQIIEHRRETVWEEQRPAFAAAGEGALGFCFSPPAGLPATEPRPEPVAGQWRCHHYWTLTLEAGVKGRPASQGFRIRVEQGTRRMQCPLPAEQAAENTAVVSGSDSLMEILARRLGLEYRETGIRFVDAARPPLVTHLTDLTAGFVLFACGAAIGSLLGGLLLIAGAGLLLRWLWRISRTLRVQLEDGEVSALTECLGMALFVRRGRLTNAAQIELRSALGGEGSHLMLVSGDRRILLARDLPAREAEMLRDCLVSYILPG